MKKQLLILSTLLLFSTFAYSQNIEVKISAVGNGNWPVPCGVKLLKVQTWGAGGGGGRSTNSGHSTGGGGGGAYAESTIMVSAGDMIPYSVGEGGYGDRSIKDGGDTVFGLTKASGGKGVTGNNNMAGAAGGQASTSTGTTINYSGGSGGNGVGDSGTAASGGGGGAARTTGSGNNGNNGTYNNNGGSGGSSASPGGSGGNGRGTDGWGADGVSYGGGGGGAKKGALILSDRNGGYGGNGGIILTYTLPTGAPQPIQAVGILNSNPGTNIGCTEKEVTLKAEGGNVGNGVSTLWYQGNSCPSFKYINEFMGQPITHATNPTTLLNGNRKFTSTSGDPHIDMTDVLSGDISSSDYKFITIRYRVIAPLNTPNQFQFYLKTDSNVLNETDKIDHNINTDGNWHIDNINMSTLTKWNNNLSGIKGWRFDYATLKGTTIEIDYLMLGNTVILDNPNNDDTIITLSPKDVSNVYGTLRVSDQEASCNAGIPFTTCIQTTIMRIDKNYEADSGNWSTASNWAPGSGVLPTINNCVKIPAGKSVRVDISNAEAKSVWVEDKANFAIDFGKSLTVQNEIINNGNGDNFVVESGGNLIQLSNAVNTGKITAKRQVKNIHNVLPNQMDYVYWSSPVAGQQTKGAGGFSPGTPSNRFYDYRESNDQFYETPDLTFVPGKGYAVRAETGPNPDDNDNPFGNGYTKTYAFKGIPNNGDIYIDIKKSAPNPVGVEHGYNLVGNPYPSDISFDVLHAANPGLIYNTVWFWTNAVPQQYQQGSSYSGNNYAVYNGTGGTPATLPVGTTMAVNGIIKVGQGFLIQKLAEGSGKLHLKNSHSGQSMRVADNSGTFYHKNTAPKSRFWLKLISPTEVNTQLIGYIDGATDGFEMDYDAEAFGLSSNLFYSLLDNKRLLIQGKANQFSIEDRINLGANYFQNGNYTIELQTPEGIFGNGQTIYLKDKLTGTITNLSQAAYVFEANKGETNGRFEIIYKPETVLVTDNKVKDGIVVYRDRDNFAVQSPKVIVAVEVYDLSGKLVTILEGTNKQAVLNSSFFAPGIYVLRIKTADGEISTKKIMK